MVKGKMNKRFRFLGSRCNISFIRSLCTHRCRSLLVVEGLKPALMPLSQTASAYHVYTFLALASSTLFFCHPVNCNGTNSWASTTRTKSRQIHEAP